MVQGHLDNLCERARTTTEVFMLCVSQTRERDSLEQQEKRSTFQPKQEALFLVNVEFPMHSFRVWSLTGAKLGVAVLLLHVLPAAVAVGAAVVRPVALADSNSGPSAARRGAETPVAPVQEDPVHRARLLVAECVLQVLKL